MNIRHRISSIVKHSVRRRHVSNFPYIFNMLWWRQVGLVANLPQDAN